MLDKVDRRFGREVFLLVRHPDVLVFNLTDGLDFVPSDCTSTTAVGHTSVGIGVVRGVLAFSVVPERTNCQV